MYGCLHAQVLQAPPHGRSLFRDWIPTHALHGPPRVQTQEARQPVCPKVGVSRQTQATLGYMWRGFPTHACLAKRFSWKDSVRTVLVRAHLCSLKLNILHQTTAVSIACKRALHLYYTWSLPSQRCPLVSALSCQAVRVQDPPHGLPAAAAGSLQLQESRQGHSLEHLEQRRTRSTEIEKIRNIMRRDGVTCMYQSFSDVPFLPWRLYYFGLV